MRFQTLLNGLKSHSFLFSELVKRDFKRKYKRTYLGVLWSILSPLMMLLVMSVVFTRLFGRNTPHFTIYLFSGNLVFHYFSETTSGGMQSLVANASILSKINIPKYLFVCSKNVQTLINFCMTLLVYFVFVACDELAFRWSFFLLLYPILCMILFNIGVSLLLSAVYVFFRDMQYLYTIILQVITYLSAIFYNINSFDPALQKLFYLNPIFCYITYFRQIVIDGVLPGATLHLLCAGYALALLGLGVLVYRKNNYRFIYYL